MVISYFYIIFLIYSICIIFSLIHPTVEVGEGPKPRLDLNDVNKGKEDPWLICLHTKKMKELVKLGYDQRKLFHEQNKYPSRYV